MHRSNERGDFILPINKIEGMQDVMKMMIIVNILSFVITIIVFVIVLITMKI